MRATATRTLRPLRPAAALLPSPFGALGRRSAGTSTTSTIKSAATRAAASTPKTPSRTVYSKSPAPSATTSSSSTTAAPKSSSAPEPSATPILDPQAAATPGEAATAASSFAPVPDPGAAGDGTIDWSASFHGLGSVPYSPEAAQILMAPLDPEDVEVKPDGIIYLPEIKYRRILNRAFGPGGWGLAPRGELIVGDKIVTREYALIAHGRFVSQARGECQYFSDESIPTAGEGCKSNALMRCCKDLGIGSELWDPRFIRSFKKNYAQEVWVEHVVTKKKRQIWTRKDADIAYPYKRS